MRKYFDIQHAAARAGLDYNERGMLAVLLDCFDEWGAQRSKRHEDIKGHIYGVYLPDGLTAEEEGAQWAEGVGLAVPAWLIASKAGITRRALRGTKARPSILERLESKGAIRINKRASADQENVFYILLGGREENCPTHGEENFPTHGEENFPTLKEKKKGREENCPTHNKSNQERIKKKTPNKKECVCGENPTPPTTHTPFFESIFNRISGKYPVISKYDVRVEYDFFVLLAKYDVIAPHSSGGWDMIENIRQEDIEAYNANRDGMKYSDIAYCLKNRDFFYHLLKDLQAKANDWHKKNKGRDLCDIIEQFAKHADYKTKYNQQ